MSDRGQQRVVGALVVGVLWAAAGCSSARDQAAAPRAEQAEAVEEGKMPEPESEPDSRPTAAEAEADATDAPAAPQLVTEAQGVGLRVASVQVARKLFDGEGVVGPVMDQTRVGLFLQSQVGPVAEVDRGRSRLRLTEVGAGRVLFPAPDAGPDLKLSHSAFSPDRTEAAFELISPLVAGPESSTLALDGQLVVVLAQEPQPTRVELPAGEGGTFEVGGIVFTLARRLPTAAGLKIILQIDEAHRDRVESIELSHGGEALQLLTRGQTGAFGHVSFQLEVAAAPEPTAATITLRPGADSVTVPVALRIGAGVAPAP